MEISEYFLGKLEFVLGKWPDDVKWTVQQLASYTTFDADEVAGYLNLALKSKVSPDDRVCREDVSLALEVLANRQASHAEADESHRVVSLERLRARVARYAEKLEWGRAYQSVSYFLGQNKNLPQEDAAELVSECLRLGIKAGRSTQELFPWLHSRFEVVGKADKQDQKELLLDLADLIDAYGAYFFSDANGRKQILALAESAGPLARKHGVTGHLERIISDLTD